LEVVGEGISEETLEFFKGDELRARVFTEKYAMKDKDGRVLEKSPIEMWHRVAREIASVEPEEKRREWEDKFYWMLEGFKFVPGGRIMFGAGQKRRATLTNCYYIPLKEDSLEAIFDWCKEAARTYSLGGGVGVDISVLRPKGSPVNNAAIFSTGSVSFMEVFSTVTGTIGQSGRRGALIITLRVDHPDIFDFIDIKRDPERRNVRYANISVRVSDEFMRAVENDEEFELKFENERVSVKKKVRARDIWDRLVRAAWESAEPGLIFWDTVKRGSTSEYNGMEVKGVNPCGEEPLEEYGCCCLGNVNLSAFVKEEFTDKAEVDWVKLEQVVRYGVRFLDDVLDYNADRHALIMQKVSSLRSRRIGLGVTGLADMLAKLRIRYDSEEALEFVDRLMERIKVIAYDESVELAKEKDPFPAFDPEKHMKGEFVERLPEALKEKIRRYGLRNVALLTVPPVGSGSVLAGTSSGVEPIFSISYTRRSESLSKKEYKVYHPLVKEYMEKFGVGEDELPDYFVTAHKIKPEFRVRMQATIQKHVDASISSTVNLPESATVEDVGSIYFLAWKLGCKGITVYREGSREGILVTKKKKMKEVRYERPRILTGSTLKFRMPQGALYVTINSDEEGVKEVFVTLGKSGADVKADSEAIGRLISLYLQQGGKVEYVIRSLKGIQGESFTWDNGTPLYSMPDAVAKALEFYIGLPEESKGLGKCPVCGKKGLVYENGCYHCIYCGYTKCE